MSEKLNKKIGKFFNFLLKNIFKIEYLIVFLLLLILASNIWGAIFALNKYKQINNQLVSLNMQFIQLNNRQTEMKTKINNLQSLFMRLQAQLYREESPENNN